MPVIVAIESSSEYCSAALLGGGHDDVRACHAGHAHSELLLPMVGQLFADNGVVLSECSGVAFGAGPGSFTGLRIACSVGQGLAFGAGLPMMPIGTLEAMAEQACDAIVRPRGLTVLVAQDARMGELYWSLVQWTGERWLALHAPSLSLPADLPGLIDLVADVGCGSGFALAPAILEPLVARRVSLDHADARAIAVLGLRSLERGEAIGAAQAKPLYVRDRVALTTVEREAKATFA